MDFEMSQHHKRIRIADTVQKQKMNSEYLRHDIVEQLIDYMENDVRYTVMISKQINSEFEEVTLDISTTPEVAFKVPDPPIVRDYTFKELALFAWKRIKKIVAKE